MLDTILKFLALACFLVNIMVVAIWVPSADLVTVIVLVTGFAAYDFFVRPYLASRRQRSP